MTRAIAGLAVLGLALSAYLTWVHYAGIEPVCSGISDCERVQSSDYAELVGVPVALIGVVGYATNDFINKLARAAGLKRLDAGTAAERQVQENERLAKTAGINSTPSFLIGKTGGTLHPLQVSDLTPGAFIPKIDSELGQ